MPRAAAPLVFEAVLRVMREVTTIQKARQADQYKFRGIDDVYNALHTPMADAGLFTTSKVIEQHTEKGAYKSGTPFTKVSLLMEYTLWAEDGSSVSTMVRGEGDDTGDKAGNKAMATAHKYALLQMFLIPTDEPKDSEDKRSDPLQNGETPSLQDNSTKEPSADKMKEEAMRKEVSSMLEKMDDHEGCDAVWKATDQWSLKDRNPALHAELFVMVQRRKKQLKNG